MQTTFLPYGDRALLIQWEQSIDPFINAEVVQLSELITNARVNGIEYCTPAYCSLTVGFRPEQISFATVCEKIKILQQQLINNPEKKIARPIKTIPVCYEVQYAPDLEWLSQHSGLEQEQIIQLHTDTSFRVYMLGFMPGFPYMGTLPDILKSPRKETPRLKVPAGSVALAGLQTGIYPITSPGGWQIIGQTPLQIFKPERDTPFFLQAGDEVRFRSIGIEEFKAIKNGTASP